MNRQLSICLTAIALLAPGCVYRTTVVQSPSQAGALPPPPPPEKLVPEPVTGQKQTYVYSQQLWNQPAPLYTQADAQEIVDQFRSNYDKMGSPRVLIYVNRQLVDENSGMKVSASSEHVDTTSTATGSGPDATNSETTRSSADHTYSNTPRTEPSLADRQTTRDIERLVAGPLREAGATIVDEGTAAELISDRPLDAITTEGEQARKDREAISKVADVVVEVLVSSRNVTVPDLTGDKTYPVPDMQMTAIRLKDSKIIGQSSAAYVIRRAGGPAQVARNYGIDEVTEATTLALMDDTLRENK
jgi:hypothetical protein